MSHFEERPDLAADMARPDIQTAVVIILAAFLGMWRSTLGAPQIFDRHLSGFFGAQPNGLAGYLYLFITQWAVGFMIPVLVLTLIFKRRPKEIGLGLGDIGFALKALAVYIPIVTAGCWLLSRQGAFQGAYPMFRETLGSRKLFVLYELAFPVYFIGWEYLWRGFLLFGTSHRFGYYSIFIQMLPFAAFHAAKPVLEAYFSIVGALLIGALVWRCRSFWIAVVIHSYQMFIMDFFCSRSADWHPY